MRELEEAQEHGRRQVLDDLRGEDAAERAVLERLEMRDQIRLLDVEPLAARVGDHVAVGVHSARLDSGLAQQREELAAAAAAVQDRGLRQEVRDIGALAAADLGGRAAHPALEGEVVGQRRGGGLRGDGRRRAGGPPLEPQQPLLELREQPLGPLAGGALGVERLREVVHELQRRVVEAALLGGERLDVPAHQRLQQPLDGIGDRALQAGAPLDRALGRDGPVALGRGTGPRAHRRTARAAPLDLDLEPLEELGGVDGNPCSFRVLRVLLGHRHSLQRGHYGSVRAAAH